MSDSKRNRSLLIGASAVIGLAALFAAFGAFTTTAEARTATITVYKNPSCGCCTKWIEHLREAGYEVEAINVSDLTAIKAQYGVSPDLGSCHTGEVDGYVIEGHVPAADIDRLLRERPSIAGLAVPGMPAGSPGMEGDRVDRYNVIAFGNDGSREVYASH